MGCGNGPRSWSAGIDEIVRVIEPSLSLEPVIAEWHGISEDLADLHRLRLSQLQLHFDNPQTS